MIQPKKNQKVLNKKVKVKEEIKNPENSLVKLNIKMSHFLLIKKFCRIANKSNVVVIKHVKNNAIIIFINFLDLNRYVNKIVKTLIKKVAKSVEKCLNAWENVKVLVKTVMFVEKLVG